MNVSPAYNQLGLSAAHQDDERSEYRDGYSDDSDDSFDAEMDDDAQSKFVKSRAVKLRANKRKYVTVSTSIPCQSLFNTSRVLTAPIHTQSGAESASASEDSVYYAGTMYAAVQHFDRPTAPSRIQVPGTMQVYEGVGDQADTGAATRVSLTGWSY
jgi:hypothetical protein